LCVRGRARLFETLPDRRGAAGLYPLRPEGPVPQGGSNRQIREVHDATGFARVARQLRSTRQAWGRLRGLLRGAIAARWFRQGSAALVTYRASKPMQFLVRHFARIKSKVLAAPPRQNPRVIRDCNPNIGTAYWISRIVYKCVVKSDSKFVVHFQSVTMPSFRSDISSRGFWTTIRVRFVIGIDPHPAKAKSCLYIAERHKTDICDYERNWRWA
jgi:hypothetical protein